MIVETKNYLHLDFNVVSKILGSSELDIHSEMQVFIAVDNWIKHNNEQRETFAKRLLLKVRFTLLSDHNLKTLRNNFSLLDNNKDYFQNKSTKYYMSRYCSQNMFNILVCDGKDINRDPTAYNHVNLMLIDVKDFKIIKTFPPMERQRMSSNFYFLKGDVYVLGGCNNFVFGQFTNYNEKFSHFTETRSILVDMYDDRDLFCACAFMDSFFVFGGLYYGSDCNNDSDDDRDYDSDDDDRDYDMDDDSDYDSDDDDGGYINNHYATNSCVQFDTKEGKWKEVSSMKHARYSAACVVFQEKVVVSGGYNNRELNSVESYDVFADKWIPMPNMISAKRFHSLVVVKNKLFAIDRNCEVFDNISKQFVALKSILNLSKWFDPVRDVYSNKAVAIGNKIYILQNNSSSIFCYDVNKDQWCKEQIEATKYIDDFFCVKMPVIW